METIGMDNVCGYRDSTSDTIQAHGTSLRGFYLSGGLGEHPSYGNLVKIRTLESFIAAANRERL